MPLNQGVMDNFTNVVHLVNSVINALIDRFGGLNVHIWVISVLPHPVVEQGVTEIIQKQNKGLAKAVGALVQRKRYPIKFITSHKWFLKKVSYPHLETLQVEVDSMYYNVGTKYLNQHGLEHFYLLLAKELRLWKVEYEWNEVPIVKARGSEKRKVLQQLEVPLDDKR